MHKKRQGADTLPFLLTFFYCARSIEFFCDLPRANLNTHVTVLVFLLLGRRGEPAVGGSLEHPVIRLEAQLLNGRLLQRRPVVGMGDGDELP